MLLIFNGKQFLFFVEQDKILKKKKKLKKYSYGKITWKKVRNLSKFFVFFSYVAMLHLSPSPNSQFFFGRTKIEFFRL
jgi:hypothetical protein